MDTYVFTNELYHHGIKGQKWYIRRFQNKDGTLTEAGKRRARTDRKESKKGQKSEPEEEEPLDKEKVIRTGDVKTAYKRRYDFSNEELNQVVNRQKTFNSVKELMPKEVSDGERFMKNYKKVSDFMNVSAKVLKDISSAEDSTIKMYNAGVSVANSLFGTKLKRVDYPSDKDNNNNSNNNKGNNKGNNK